MKKIILSVLIGATILSTSCLGSFKLFGKMNEIVSGATGNKYLNQIIFIALWIIPVYEIVLFVDLWVFNLVEFWTGSNLLAMAPGEVETQEVNYKGVNYRMVGSLNRLEITTMSGSEKGSVNVLSYNPTTSTWSAAKNGAEAIPVLSFNNGMFTIYGKHDTIQVPGGEVASLYFTKQQNNNVFAFAK